MKRADHIFFVYNMMSIEVAVAVAREAFLVGEMGIGRIQADVFFGIRLCR